MVKNSLVFALLACACSAGQPATEPRSEPEQAPQPGLVCVEVAACLASCAGDMVCVGRCRDRSNPGSFQKFEDAFLCGQAHSCDTAECLIQYCEKELNECRLDRGCNSNSCPIR